MRKIILYITALVGLLVPAPAAAQEITVVAVPNPIELPEILFIVALCGFALWKKNWLRIPLSVGIIIWGVFTLPYDIKLAGPLVALGSILFIAGIIRVAGWELPLLRREER